MRFDNTIFETEQREQSSIRIIFWLVTLAGFALALYVIGFNPVSFILIPIAGAYVVKRSLKMESEFEQRLIKIAFKTHIGNLYVYDNEENDRTTIGRRDAAIALLKETGNEHRVHVHTALFRDVVVFINWWENGVLKEKREFRKEVMTANETWEDYVIFLTELKRVKDNEFLMSSRKDSTGDEWLNGHFFKQDAT